MFKRLDYLKVWRLEQRCYERNGIDGIAKKCKEIFTKFEIRMKMKRTLKALENIVYSNQGRGIGGTV